MWAAILGLISAALLTDSEPAARARPAPSAEQVQAGRDAVSQILAGSKRRHGLSAIRLGDPQFDGLSALTTNLVQPDRLDAAVRDDVLHVTASHPLPWNRWLNLKVSASGSRRDGASIHIRIGSIPVPNILNDAVFGIARLLLHHRGVVLPQFDGLVRTFAVENGTVVATVQTPVQSDWLYRLAGDAGRADPALVVRSYCRLAEAQREDPQTDFAVQVRRGFPTDEVAAANADRNRAALVALAMLIVDKQVGQLAGLSAAQLAECTAPSAAIALHGRTDLPKHLSMSAAIAAQAGVQLAEAMGEWKELSDSLARQSEFQPADASGFSFVDLAADRSGFRIGRDATSVIQAKSMAQRLSRATDSRLLPPALLAMKDGLQSADFVKSYGAIDDPRFLKAVGSIDDVLTREGMFAR